MTTLLLLTVISVEILLHPESRLVSTETSQVTFYCKIRDGSQHSIYWIVNGSRALYENQITRLHAQGYYITREHLRTITTLTLIVNVTENKNGINIYCTYRLETNSEKALLLITSGEYIDNHTSKLFVLRLDHTFHPKLQEQ